MRRRMRRVSRCAIVPGGAWGRCYSMRRQTLSKYVASHRRFTLIKQSRSAYPPTRERSSRLAGEGRMIPKATISIFIKRRSEQSTRRWGLSGIILSLDTGDVRNITLSVCLIRGQMFLTYWYAAGLHGEEPAGCWGMLDFYARGSPELFDMT